jgi:hypothetical protein
VAYPGGDDYPTDVAYPGGDDYPTDVAYPGGDAAATLPGAANAAPATEQPQTKAKKKLKISSSMKGLFTKRSAPKPVAAKKKRKVQGGQAAESSVKKKKKVDDDVDNFLESL